MSAITVPVVGEPLALDLINTRAMQPGGSEVDFLRSPEAAQAWLAAEGDRLESPAGDVDLRALRRLRDHVARAVDAARHGTEPPASALEALTTLQRSAPRYRVLGWDGTRVTATGRRDGGGTGGLLADLAEAATDLITDPLVRNVRQCEAPDCRLLFLPAHPRRRWCSPALCGNRVRVARYYERHRNRT
jgi:predicted RNA-binding Zn ribbon-like protein